MGAFSEDTAVTRVGEGRYTGAVSRRWFVLGDVAPNGGYLMAIAARAMADAAQRPDPVTITAHFLRPPTEGEVSIDTTVVKSGRRHVIMQGALSQDGRECVRLLGAFTDLDAADGPTRVDRRPPDLPPPEDCVDIIAAADARTDGRVFAPPILRRFDHRMPAGTMDWVFGQPLGRGEIGGHCRFADDEPISTLALLVVADAYPPAVFNSGETVGWVPTIELTVQVRRRPAPGWLRTRIVTEHITRGYLEEDGEIWDESGDLVVLSRQLALVAQHG